MSEVFADGGFVLDTPEDIDFFRLLSMKGRLKMEVRFGKSFSSRGPATSTIVRNILGSKTRDKAKLLEELEEKIEEIKGQKA